MLNSYHVTGKVVIAMDTDQETLDWIQKGLIAATIAQKPYTMAFVGMQMLDNLYHHKPASLDTDWSKDTFAPIPSFVDTGSALIDKSNVDIVYSGGKESGVSSEVTAKHDSQNSNRMRLVDAEALLCLCTLLCAGSLGSALDRQPNPDYHARREALARKRPAWWFSSLRSKARTLVYGSARTITSTISPA